MKIINFILLFIGNFFKKRTVESLKKELNRYLDHLKYVIISKDDGVFSYYLYFLTDPNEKNNKKNTMGHFYNANGFVELDCRFDFEKKRKIRHKGDLEEFICNELTAKIIKIMKKYLKKYPYTRVIIEKTNKTSNVEITSYYGNI